MNLLNNTFTKNYQIALAALVVAVSYFLGAKIGLILSFKPDYIAALWPPNAILLAALLLSKPKHWWCFLLVSVPAEMAADLPSGVPWQMALGFLAGDWTEALAGALLLRQFRHIHAQQLSNLKQVVVYLVCCVFCAPFIAAFIGALTPFLGETHTGYWAAWRLWFLGDALTHLTISPVLILGITLFTQEQPFKGIRDNIDASFLFVLLIIVSFITFGFAGNLATGLPVLLYLPVPILLWIAVRFGTRGIFPAVFILTLIAIWNASHGQGPFSHQAVGANVMSLQIFLLVVLIPLVFLAALIEERKRTTQQLSLFRSLIDKSNDAIFVVDPGTGRFLDANNTACKRLGYSKQEILEIGVTDLNPDFKSKSVWEDHVNKIHQSHVLVLESTHTRKNGSAFPVEISISYISQTGNDLILAVARDITERKRMEDDLLTKQKLESIGLLAGGIAHDFNNLLTAIMGNVSMAKIYLAPEEKAYRRLEETEKATMRARDLTQRLLTFSKGGAPVIQTVSIKETIKDSASFILSGTNVSSEFDFAENLWPVDVDEAQISQVIQNLVKNADQAMPKGGMIKISAKNIHVKDNKHLPLPEGRYVHLSVADQGAGIPEENLTLIFDPYFSTKKHGSGLGLATSYSIITNHDGLMTVDSHIGKGTTFNIYLPASEKECPAQQNTPEKLNFGSGRILLMDDEAEVREVVSNMLKHLGYNVEQAVNGEEAVEIYLNAQKNNTVFAAVILDLTVPGGLGGRETVRKLLKIDPAVKAIISSGFSNNPVMADFRKFGFLGLIKKPFRLQDLSDTLHRCNHS